MDTAAAFRSPQDRPAAGPAAARPGGSVTALVRPVEHPLGPPRPAGVAGHLHHPRGGRRVGAAGPPLQRGEGLGGPAAPGRQGVQAGADPLPGAPRGHRPQLPRGARLPGRPGGGGGSAPPRGQGAGLHRPGPGRRPGADGLAQPPADDHLARRHQRHTGSTPPSAAPAATRTRREPRSASSPSATPSGSGIPKRSDPSSGSCTRAACDPASTCARSRCRTGPSSTSGSTSGASGSSCPPSTTRTSARCSSGTACCSP